MAKAAPDPSPRFCVSSVAIPGMYIAASIKFFSNMTYRSTRDYQKNVIKINFLTFYKLSLKKTINIMVCPLKDVTQRPFLAIKV